MKILNEIIDYVKVILNFSVFYFSILLKEIVSYFLLTFISIPGSYSFLLLCVLFSLLNFCLHFHMIHLFFSHAALCSHAAPSVLPLQLSSFLLIFHFLRPCLNIFCYSSSSFSSHTQSEDQCSAFYVLAYIIYSSALCPISTYPSVLSIFIILYCKCLSSLHYLCH